MSETTPTTHIKDISQSEPLTRQDVEGIVDSFLKHIRDNWDFYKSNLPALRRTMMYYNEFTLALPKLPEYETCADDFDSNEALSAESLLGYFGEALTDEAVRLVNAARPRRMDGSELNGYKEPIEDTPETLFASGEFPSIESARAYMYDTIGTDFRWFGDQRLESAGYGTPQIVFAGFTTAEEFPAQTALLDTIRDHPRIQHGIHLLEEGYRQRDLARQVEREAIIATVEASKADRVKYGTSDTGEGLSRNEAVRLVADIWRNLQD